MSSKVNEENGIRIADLYSSSNAARIQAARFRSLAESFDEKYGAGDHLFFSSPGRIEIGGNHTDHNNGFILAAAIDIDSIAAVAANTENKVNLFSRDMNELYSVDLNDLQVKENEKGTTSSLIRGIASKFVQEGHRAGGFNCVLESRIGIGSGLSSSASIEVLIGSVLNYLYNGSKISYVDLARFGQFAENKYFGKPCGLMDQLAIAAGGVVSVDFYDKDKPGIEKLNLNLEKTGFAAVIVNTGGTHADLTDDYAAVPSEMKSVAKHLGCELLRFTDRAAIMKNLSELRKSCGDRAVLRALHFMEENERVGQEVSSLKSGDIKRFLELVQQSGNSSARWLQNIYSNHSIMEQNIPLALEVTEFFFKKNSRGGACRVHGGGFAGTILVFIEQALLKDYLSYMNSIFGEGSSLEVSVRNSGAGRVIL